MKRIKKRNLRDMAIKAVALVDKGANKRTFFLHKRADGGNMDKDLAIELIKSGDLDDSQMEKILKAADEEDRDDIQDAIDAVDSAGVSKSGGTTDQRLENLEKAGRRFSKKTLAAIAKLEELVSKLAENVKTLKGEGGEEEGEEKGEKGEKKGVKKSADDDKDIDAAEFEKMLNKELEKEGLLEETAA